jgi:AcrR family transcriptional regulator
MNNTQKPARGRPREFDISIALQKAMQVFWREGYDAASISILTEAMDINAPSFYSAFGSKENLFCRVLDAYHAPFVVMATELMSAPQGTLESFQQLLTSSSKSQCGMETVDGCLIVTSGVMVFRQDSEIGKKLAELVEINRRMFVARLKKGQRDGDVSPSVNARQIADYVNGLLHAMASVGRISQSRPAVQAIANVGIETLRREFKKSD